MSKKALLIGINYYATPQTALQGCINDIINMRNTLIDAYDYKESNIRMLRDDVPTLLPTRQAITNALKQLVAESASLSEVWIHYSGHGTKIRDSNGDEADGQDEAIVPSDYGTAGIIVDDELFAIIKDIKCTAIICFDSCHSGTAIDLQYSFNYTAGSFGQVVNNTKAIENKNIFFFSGCRDNQTSADAYNVETKQPVGAFTDSLLNALRQNGHKVDIMKLYNDLCFIISRKGYIQCPVLSCSSNIPTYKFERTNVVDKINVITQVVTQVVQVSQPLKPTMLSASSKPSNSVVKPPVKKYSSFKMW